MYKRQLIKSPLNLGKHREETDEKKLYLIGVIHVELEKGEREKRDKRGERAGETGERNGKRKRKHDKRMGRRIDGMNGKKEAADGATIDGANPRPGRTGSPSGAIKKGR